MSRPEKPQAPDKLDTPGLSWRPRKAHWVALWVGRQDILERGYAIKSVRLWPPSEDTTRAEPDAEEWLTIASQCERLQSEMLEWGSAGPKNWDPRAVYDGTIKSLIRVFQTDPDSPYANLRTQTRKGYDSLQSTIERAVGAARVPELTFRDFRRWHENFCKPKIDGQPPRKARAHGLMTQVRILVSFGKLVGLAGCAQAKEILSDMEFQTPQRRTTFITAPQCIAFRHEAHRRGLHSMALAQALQFELMLRQKDVIGEWVPTSEPGLSEVTHAGRKWINGVHWKEVSPELILTHRLSKSLKGRDAIADPSAGKTEQFDLTTYPMVMEELALASNRVGPMIVFERTGRPWDHKYFGGQWRKIARAVGIPDKVQNRDSRAGAITEAFDSGAIPDQVRRGAGHSQLSTTMIYSRDSLAARGNVTQLRVKNRPKT